LPGDDDHGDAVHVGRGNTCHRIGHARTRCDQRYTDFTGGTGIAVSRMNGCLLMSNQHMFYGVLFIKRVVNMQNSTAWVTPYKLDTFGLQRFDQDIGAIDFDGGLAQRIAGVCGLGRRRLGSFHGVNLCEFRRRKTQGAFLQLFLEAHQDFGSRAISVSHHARTLFDWEPKIMTLFDIALASSPFNWRRVT
jgi:hypothetical protein